MVADLLSSFKLCIINCLNSHNINVDPTAIKILTHHVGDALIHCGKSKWESSIIENLRTRSDVLEIDDISAEQNRLVIKLNRLSTFNRCFKEIFSTETLFPISTWVDPEDKVI